MNNLSIKEKNELIEIFKNGKNYKRHNVSKWVNGGDISIKNNYLKDWNKLMKVYEKFSSLSLMHSFSINKKFVDIDIFFGGKNYGGSNYLYNERTVNDDILECAFDAIVKYIIWHNYNFDNKFILNTKPSEYNNFKYNLK